MKLTNDEMLKLQQNLTVGKCPNCGYEGNKGIGFILLISYHLKRKERR